MAASGKSSKSADHNGQAGEEDTNTSQAQLPLYEMSSQFRHWRYSHEGLQRARQELNDTAVQRVRSMLEEERESGASNMDETPKPNEVQYLTVSDELSLVTYYLAQLTRLCKAFKFPTHVESTAMTYLKRFYLRNTCMDYHPKNIMLTCLFLSTKTENHPISIGNFTSKIPKTTDQDVLSLEFLVAQSLKFQFKIHHADLAGRGMFLDMQTMVQDSPADFAHLADAVYPAASAAILSLRLTDAEFIYTPSQIALGAFYLADRSITERWLGKKSLLAMESKLHKKQSHTSPAGGNRGSAEGKSNGGSLSAEEISHYVVPALLALLENAKSSVDVEHVREVDRRLKYCKNPEKDPSSELYKKREREREEEAEKKKMKKVEEIRKKEEEEGNPFM